VHRVGTIVDGSVVFCDPCRHFSAPGVNVFGGVGDATLLSGFTGVVVELGGKPSVKVLQPSP
jgi:hypothetical protein